MFGSRGRIAIVVVALFGLFAANAYACRIIEPRPPRPVPQTPKEILTREHSARIEVKDQVATVTVNATFYNPNRFQMEGTYWFPLPAEASVTEFHMEINGEKVEGELLDADRAKRIYEDIVRRRKDPALLEWVGTQMLKCRIFPMEPTAETKVELSYTHLLREDAGLVRLQYPLRSARPNAGTVDQLVVTVDIEATQPLKAVYCPTHEFDVRRDDDHKAHLSFEGRNVDPSRDIEIVFSRHPGEIDLSILSHKPPAEDGYFMMMVTPKVELDPEDVAEKDIIFVLDISGSMNINNRMEQAKKALEFCIGSLNEGDRFGIITFSSGLGYFHREFLDATPDNVAAAREFINGLSARGGTALNDALIAGLEMAEDARNVPMIVFLTDGQPTVGERNIEAILGNVRDANKNNVRIFVFGVGHDVNTRLLDLVAEQNQGAREYAQPGENVEEKVSALYTKLARPVLSDVNVAFSGGNVEQTYPRNLPDLFHGSQLTVLGRFRTPGKYTATLTGTVRGEERTTTYEIELKDTRDDDYLPRLWALRKVAFLLDEIRLHGETEELVEEITHLGKRHGIITPYTSFLVLEDDAPIDEVTRRELNQVQAEAQRRFEATHAPAGRIGRDAVGDSAELAEAQRRAIPAPATAASVFGIRGGFGRDTRREAEFQQRLDEAVRQTVKQVNGRTFYARSDGAWVDSEYEEAEEERIQDIALWSDEFIELAARYRVVARVAAETQEAILVLDGTTYRIR